FGVKKLLPMLLCSHIVKEWNGELLSPSESKEEEFVSAKYADHRISGVDAASWGAKKSLQLQLPPDRCKAHARQLAKLRLRTAVPLAPSRGAGGVKDIAPPSEPTQSATASNACAVEEAPTNKVHRSDVGCPSAYGIDAS